jgi:HAD superfamily hydrolase (TIGR01509 family)
MSQAVEAVVFDCDGVLVDSERINNQVLAALVTRAGLPTTVEDTAARYMGRSTAECVAEVEHQLGRPLAFDLAAEYEDQVLYRQRAGLAAVPGVEKLLDGLRTAGIPVCVASSGTPHEIALRLALTGLDRFFGNHCYSASMVSRGKPAPDLFLLAAEGIGVDPTECMVIEDSPYGVRGGKAAGMTVVGYAALASARALRDAGADHVISDMADALVLLG